MSSTLLIRSADLYYGAAQALYGVTIECKPGRITSVLGRNGVGKSSTLRAVTGINNVAAGEIVFDNDVLKRPRPTGGRAWASATCRRAARSSRC
jgi:urea transport system ATP-binding protein